MTAIVLRERYPQIWPSKTKTIWIDGEIRKQIFFFTFFGELTL